MNSLLQSGSMNALAHHHSSRVCRDCGTFRTESSQVLSSMSMSCLASQADKSCSHRFLQCLNCFLRASSGWSQGQTGVGYSRGPSRFQSHQSGLSLVPSQRPAAPTLSARCSPTTSGRTRTCPPSQAARDSFLLGVWSSWAE